MDFLAGSIQLLTVMALPFLLAVTLHEAGHALAAYRLGDPTAKLEGRLSLNPAVHIDPVGTIVIPLVAILANFPFLIGYAKPVMIQPRYFKNMRRDMVIVALAGPLGNLLVAIFFAIVLKVAISSGASPEGWLFQTAVWGVRLNCLFMVFNLLPIPPLDGAGVVEQFLPHDVAQSYRSIAPFGFFILMGIILVAQEVITVPTMLAAEGVLTLVGLA
ncbi:site-2 protease family protein [Kordiimonas lacus]|uniref:Zn-dependent protease (Includes SpoIVFB) n=1 Tax=Kordiimonas lacus TaxID=637679 RepID=A0A1G6VQJ1_9PROT|nr:site-2 protease family protein [Kordiimonas lacus]SDD55801.1 Zn-dependent protease (includes SpoIVFB) [Kordiimonas lacus]